MIGYCYGDYQKYIPIFVNSVLHCYNSIDLLFLCTERVRQSINQRIKRKYRGRIKIVENFFPIKNYTYDAVSKYISKSQFYRLLRFLIPKKYFNGYSYAYIGDIDIFYFNLDNFQKSNLFNRELKLTNQNDLSFNNIMRTDQKGNTSWRLGGLHFIKVKEYYKEYGEKIKRLSEKKDYFIELIEKIKESTTSDLYIRNEHLLFILLIEPIDIEKYLKMLPEDSRLLYGMHLGPLRSNVQSNRQLKLFDRHYSTTSIQIRIIYNFINFIILNKLFYFLKTKDMIHLCKYSFRLIIN